MLRSPEMMHGVETAYVMINCEPGSEESVIDELKTIDGVKETIAVSGDHDILTKIEARSIDSLRDLIGLKIRRIQKIRSTTTLVSAKSKNRAN